MVRLFGLSTYYWVIAQSSSGGGTPINFEVLGVSGTIVAILLYILKTLWSDNKELRAENLILQQANVTVIQESVERVSSIAAQASTQLTESAKTLEATTVMMHQLAGRPGVNPEQLAELTYHLRALREIRERGANG